MRVLWKSGVPALLLAGLSFQLSLPVAIASESAIQADPGVGGPETIGAQLEIDNTRGNYRYPVVVFKDWFARKQRINDEYGLGYNYSSVLKETGPPNQEVLEAYYRFMLTEHLEFSPDIQYVRNPTLDPSIDSIT